MLLNLVRRRGARRECGTETGRKDAPDENRIDDVILAEYHHGVTPRERGTTEVWGVQLVSESMSEGEGSVSNVGFGELLACWSVNVDDLSRCAQPAVEHVREDGLFGDWDGRPVGGVNDHGLDGGWASGWLRREGETWLSVPSKGRFEVPHGDRY